MKTKIDERREREAYDKEHPWQPRGTARADGTVCDLLTGDMAGTMTVAGHWCLHLDGSWYRVDEPGERSTRIMNWRAIPRALKVDLEERKRAHQHDDEQSRVHDARLYD